MTSTDGMTPPDSGDLQHECRCGYHIVGRDAEGSHTWSKCKPHSGERDACYICQGTKGGVPGNENRILVCDHCHAELMDKRWRADTPPVSLPLSLAQRILAALETGMAGTIGEAQKQIALADELRAIVERKT